jgi:DNA-binding MarR family transcriptional regulator
MGVVKSRISKLIEGLVNKGLIRRFKDPADSRIALLQLTTEGQAKLKQINDHLRAANAEVLSQMAPTQREDLLRHLDILRLSMKTSLS